MAHLPPESVFSAPVGEVFRRTGRAAGHATASLMGRSRDLLSRRDLIRAGAGLAGIIAVASAPYLVLRRLGDHLRGGNIMLLIADSMRADKLGKVVNGLEVTPFLNALVRDSVRFQNAYAAASWTKPSIASILTGQYPQHHGVSRLDAALPDMPSLPAFFIDMGFFAAGFTANPVTRPELGTGQGVRCGYGYPFVKHNDGRTAETGAGGMYCYLPPRAADRFGDGTIHEGYIGSGAVFAALRGIIRRSTRVRRGYPFFGYLHDMRTHIPWLSSRPIPGVIGRFSPTPEPTEAVYAGYMDALKRFIRAPGRPVPPPEVRRRIEAMNDEAAFCYDTHVGAFIQWLKREGIYDDSTIVFTADHGDAFYEHGRLGHAQDLSEEVLRVPLIIKHPATPPREIRARVSNASIFPTVAELFGDTEATTGNVVSLAPYMRGEVSSGEDRLNTLSLMAPDYEKVIVPGGASATRRNGGIEYHNVSDDPLEARRLPPNDTAKRAMERESGSAKAFAREAGIRFIRTNLPELQVKKMNSDGTFRISDKEKARVPEEMRRQLQALGYLQ